MFVSLFSCFLFHSCKILSQIWNTKIFKQKGQLQTHAQLHRSQVQWIQGDTENLAAMHGRMFATEQEQKVPC